jgi:dimethylargininase
VYFTHAIVRLPCQRITEGLSTAGLGPPDHRLALHQHGHYVEALEGCGLEVRILPADNAFPDSTFVEDTALLTRAVAVITNPGAGSRKGETRSMQEVVRLYYDNLEHIKPPGTLEAGDVMMCGNHFFIGLSERTNEAGAAQLKAILEKHGMTASFVEVPDILHLKSGVSYLEHNNLLATESLASHLSFAAYNIIPVPAHEAYAANSLWVNGKVLVAEGYPETLKNIRAAGYETIELAMSEFRKVDGGLSCLSLRF